MADTSPIPRQLESPPRTTGNAQLDFPLIIDWIFRAYQVIQAAVNYINGQVSENPDLNIADLPDPASSTVAQAQQTANQAYKMAADAKTLAENIQKANISGTVAISDTSTTASVTFPKKQVNTEYTVFVQAKSSNGAAATDSFIITSKTYTVDDFSFTIKAPPGSGNSITYDWQLVRNS